MMLEKDTVQKTLSLEDLLNRLRLIRSENIGPISYYRLLKKYGSPERALEALPSHAKKGGRMHPLKVPSLQDIKQEWDATLAFGGRYVFHHDPEYPELLKQLRDAPPVLITQGCLDLLKRPCLGVVGTRNASLHGRKLTSKLCKDISEDHGLVIVSGLARGIDRCAHEGSFKSGTIACIAGGLDQPYPDENKDLHDAISREGLLITESPLGHPPKTSSFPKRNRLISGLSQALLVVEGGIKSGSMITAKCALDQGREVMAIPGSPLDPRSHGPNNLIQNGARLIQTSEDIIEAMGGFMSIPHDRFTTPHCLEEPLTEQEYHRARLEIRDLLSYHPIAVSKVAEEVSLSYSQLSHILLDLEIAGVIVYHPGHAISLSPP